MRQDAVPRFRDGLRTRPSLDRCERLRSVHLGISFGGPAQQLRVRLPADSRSPGRAAGSNLAGATQDLADVTSRQILEVLVVWRDPTWQARPRTWRMSPKTGATPDKKPG